jgi:hypothetical protein
VPSERARTTSTAPLTMMNRPTPILPCSTIIARFVATLAHPLGDLFELAFLYTVKQRNPTQEADRSCTCFCHFALPLANRLCPHISPHCSRLPGVGESLSGSAGETVGVKLHAVVL